MITRRTAGIIADIGFLIFLILLMMLLASVLFGCAFVERTLLGTPMEREIWSVRRENANCLAAAFRIAEIRRRYGLRTRIVIAWGETVVGLVPGSKYQSDPAPYQQCANWHSFCRDEKDGLIDTGAGTVLATMMFEFEYRPGMSFKQASPIVRIYLDGSLYIKWRCVPEWGKYEILIGIRHVTVLHESLK